jgi:hypothetical protein
MGGLVPRLNCPDEARRSNPHRRPPCVIRFPPRGPCGLPPPEGLVGLPKRLLLREANVLEEVVVGAFGDFAECASLLRACNPFPDRRRQTRDQTGNPGPLTNQVVKPKSPGAQRRSACECREHCKDSDFRVEPDSSPTKRSRINRSRYRRPAKHRFSGLPEFSS